MFFGSIPLFVLQFVIGDAACLILMLIALFALVIWAFWYSWHHFRALEAPAH